MKILILSHVDTGIKFFFEQHFSKFLIYNKHQVSFDLDKNFNDICLYSESYDSLTNLRKLRLAKKYVVLDPKMNSRVQILNLKDSDGAIVSSLEQAEKVNKYQKNILIQPWFRFSDTSNISMLENASNSLPSIVYHGNKVHLEASRDTLVRALQRLSKERQFIFTPIYNIKKLGIWKRFLPRGVNIRHIQWEPETYLSHIAQSDIGVVPNFLPTGPKLLNYWGHKIVENSKIGVRTNINRKDYLNRYKFTSNSGRLYEYALLAKPVVAEPTLSISQDIVHNKDGFLVLTEEGWYSSLKTLIDNPKLRNNLGISFKKNFLAKHSKEHYFEKMQDFLQSIIEPKN